MAITKIKNPFGHDSGAWWLGLSGDAKPTPSTFNAHDFYEGAFFFELDIGTWYAWDGDSWAIAGSIFGGSSGVSGETQYAVSRVVSGTITYLGEAVPGSLSSAAVWRIQKIDTAAQAMVVWADGNANFDNIFDNYLSLSYG